MRKEYDFSKARRAKDVPALAKRQAEPHERKAYLDAYFKEFGC